MKHSKEWHTCDRCGVEIKPISRNEMKYTRFGDCLEPRAIFPEESTRGELSSCELLFNHSYDLCHKCMKDFERFMRNES